MTESRQMLPAWLCEPFDRIAARIKSNEVPHAILLTGEQGHGKGMLAQHIVSALLCTSRTTEGHACGQCPACHYLAAGTHPDYFEIRPESSEQIRIDQIRQLSSQIMMTKSISSYACSLITPAERLNRNAANALLKTLEEPPPSSVIILLAHQVNRLPATIRSRCQRIHVRARPHSQVITWLEEQTDQPAEQVEQALFATHQAPLRAAEFLNQGQAAQYAAFVDDLGAVHARKIDPATLAQNWSADDLGRNLSWWLACINQIARRLLDMNRDSLHQCHDFHQTLLRTIRLHETAVRDDQLIESLLMAWQKMPVGIDHGFLKG